MTVGALESLTNRVANALVQHGFQPGDALAIDMPLTAESVAIYLGILKAGGVVVSIADSFVAPEVALRLQVDKPRQSSRKTSLTGGTKCCRSYEKVVAANAPRAIVLPAHGSLAVPLRKGDLSWEQFLVAQPASPAVAARTARPDQHPVFLGTTGTPKAIAWTQTTPIKCAADAFFHQDVHPGDVLAWPTNLGWMMDRG